MWQLSSRWPDHAALAQAWSVAQPFPHLIIDELLEASALAELMEILEEEPVEPYASDLFAFEATTPEPSSAELSALRDQFTLALAPALGRLCGRPLRRVDLRAYAYRPGHYLLPHSDHQLGLGRVLAYAYYLPTPEPPVGGELELFACGQEAGELVDIVSAVVIAPRPNRLVVFEVGERSLHQVREVLGGLRLSIAGWFYP